MSYERPMRPQDMLGNKVKLESEKLENDVWAQGMLADIAKAMPIVGHQYMGSIAVHIYRTSDDALSLAGEYGISMKTQMNIGDMNEYIAMMAVSNLALEMRKHFGRDHKTTDQNDRR